MSGVWLSVAPTMDMEKKYSKMCFNKIGQHVQNLKNIVNSIVNIIGGPIWPFDENKNLRFDLE